MPEENIKLRLKVTRNLAVTQFKLRQYEAALNSFETIMAAEPSARVGFSIILCRCLLGDGPQQLKDAFSDVVHVELEVTQVTLTDSQLRIALKFCRYPDERGQGRNPKSM